MELKRLNCIIPRLGGWDTGSAAKSGNKVDGGADQEEWKL